MKTEGITQGPFYAVVNAYGAWSVQIGPSQYDQSIAYIGQGNAYIETGSAKGNAQLFAASPKMLAALKLTLQHIENLNAHPSVTGKWMTVVVSAIAEAEGAQ